MKWQSGAGARDSDAIKRHVGVGPKQVALRAPCELIWCAKPLVIEPSPQGYDCYYSGIVSIYIGASISYLQALVKSLVGIGVDNLARVGSS